MVPDPRFTMLGLEYFCFEGDALWSPRTGADSDGDERLAMLGLRTALKWLMESWSARPRPIRCTTIAIGAMWLACATFWRALRANLQVAGRKRMHKYDNQDHAMLTGLMAARNVMGSSFDLWRVNSDAEYLEDEVESVAVEPRFTR